MSADLLNQGLMLYASGDFEGAAVAWVQARRANPADRQITAYLDHLRSMAADVVDRVERDLAAGPAAVAQRGPEAPAAPPPPPAEALDPDAIVLALPDSGSEVAAPPAPFEAAQPESVALALPESQEAAPSPPGAAALSGGTVTVGGDRDPSEPRVIRGAPPPARASHAGATEWKPAPAPAPHRGPPPPPVEDQADPWGGDGTLAPSMAVRSSAPGLALVEPRARAAGPAVAASRDLAGLEARLRELNELDDFSGVMILAQQLLALVPEHPRALAAQARSRQMLTKMYASEVGDLRVVPHVLIAPDQVIWLDLDHRAGFVLSQVDGFSSYEDIVAVTGMDELESLSILAKLVREKIIGPS